MASLTKREIGARRLPRRLQGRVRRQLAASLILSLFLLADHNSVAMQMPAAVSPAVPSFEVASIKPSRQQGMISFRIVPGLFQMSGVTFQYMVAYAYGVRPDQVRGGPAWMNTQRFDINAKEREETVSNLRSLTPAQRVEQLHDELRLLLVDRFGLVAQRSSAIGSVYNLGVLASGSHLQPSTSAFPGGVRVGSTTMDLTAQTTGVLAAELAERIGADVLDGTHLGGEYDVHLDWTRHDTDGQEETSRGDEQPTLNFIDPGPSEAMSRALEEELGLELKKVRAPIAVVVVSSAKYPDAD